MNSSLNPSATWLLFCKERTLKQSLVWTCIFGPRKIEAEFGLTFHCYDVAVEGSLLGARFNLEAKSRRRLEGDVHDSHVPLFVGNFGHKDGASGEFTIRPKENGELMTLGLYGAPHSIRIVKIDSACVACPLEVHGIADVDVRFENFGDTWHKASLAKNELPTKPGWRYYAGRCISAPTHPAETPPLVAVLAMMTITYQQILIPHYLTDR